MVSLHYLITGAESGLGEAFSQAVLAAGHRLTALCYRAGTLAESDARVVESYDVRSAPPIEAPGVIDRLILCAGVFQPDSLDTVGFESVLDHFQVNALGALRVAHRFLPNMERGGRIVFLSSCWGSMTDNFGKFYAYRASKAALNAFAVSLARDLQSQGISVLLLHPGFVASELTGFQGKLTPDQSVERLLPLIEGRWESGAFLDYHGEQVSW